jgi:hypothetical protein
MPDPPNPVQRALTILSRQRHRCVVIVCKRSKVGVRVRRPFLGEFSSAFSDPSRIWVNKPRKRGNEPVKKGGGLLIRLF